MAEKTNNCVVNSGQCLDKAEQDMAAMVGMKLYKKGEGFTQAQLYTLGGRNDCVFTLIFRPDSESIQRYGDLLTVCFVYTRDERKVLQKDARTGGTGQCLAAA